MEESIKNIILQFDWWNYGLDDVSETTSDDWASALAEEIWTELRNEN